MAGVNSAARRRPALINSRAKGSSSRNSRSSLPAPFTRGSDDRPILDPQRVVPRNPSGNAERPLGGSVHYGGDLFHGLGYVGKWHLGEDPQSLPTAHGFDESDRGFRRPARAQHDPFSGRRLGRGPAAPAMLVHWVPGSPAIARGRQAATIAPVPSGGQQTTLTTLTSRGGPCTHLDADSQASRAGLRFSADAPSLEGDVSEAKSHGVCLGCGISGSIMWLEDRERWTERCRRVRARGGVCRPNRAEAFARCFGRPAANRGEQESGKYQQMKDFIAHH